MSFRSFVTAGLGAAAALGTYAFLIEPRWLERTHTRIAVPHLPPALAGLRIALLTDFHPGEGTSYAFIERACRLAADARPDLVALTGDLVDTPDDDLGRVLNLVTRHIDAPLGYYAVPGNHDHDTAAECWHRTLAAHRHVTDVTNTAVLRDVDGATLRIAGVDDLARGRPDLRRALHAAPDADVTLLLAHNPDTAEHAHALFGRVDLVVSGHTHGGQVRLPFVGAIKNPAQHYEQGLAHRPWAQVYTSRGVGTVHLPARFLCRPEVAILELVRD